MIGKHKSLNLPEVVELSKKVDLDLVAKMAEIYEDSGNYLLFIHEFRDPEIWKSIVKELYFDWDDIGKFKNDPRQFFLEANPFYGEEYAFAKEIFRNGFSSPLSETLTFRLLGKNLKR